MSRTTEALFAAVYADPAADGPRAVLADHLLEEGDPRGEFIALQLQRARGPLSASGARRERALLDAHELPWLGPLGAVVMPTTTVWERGFLAAAQARLHGETVGDPRWATVQKLWLLAPDHARPLELTGGTMRSLVELLDATPVTLDVLVKAPRLSRQRSLQGFGEPGGSNRPPLEHVGCVLGRTARGFSAKQIDRLLKLAELPQLRALTLHLTPFWTALELDWLWKSRLARRLQQLTLSGLPPLDVAGAVARSQSLTGLHQLRVRHRTAEYVFRRGKSGSFTELSLELLATEQPTIDATIVQPLAALPIDALGSFTVIARNGERIRKLGTLRAQLSRFPHLLPIEW